MGYLSTVSMVSRHDSGDPTCVIADIAANRGWESCFWIAACLPLHKFQSRWASCGLWGFYSESILGWVGRSWCDQAGAGSIGHTEEERELS